MLATCHHSQCSDSKHVCTAVQDGTFVLCTSHEKKGYLPAFKGYTREKEQELKEFAMFEVMDLLYHKNLSRFLSPNLIDLVDPEFDPPSPPSPRRKKRKKKVPPKAVAAATAPRSPRVSPVGEEAAMPASPYSARSRRTATPKSPPGQSNNLADFSAFWDEEEDD